MSQSKRTAPAWMTGIKQGEWQQISKFQLQSKQRPCYPLKTRVWATLILHTGGYQGELAVKMAHGKKEPMTIADIAKELNQATTVYYREAGIDKPLERFGVTPEGIRRAILDLQEDGLCERRGDTRGAIEIYCWLIPKTPPAERVRKQYAEAVAEKQTPPDETFSIPQVFRAFHLPLPTKSQTADAEYRAKVEQCYEAARQQFITALKTAGVSPNLRQSRSSPVVRLSSPSHPHLAGGGDPHFKSSETGAVSLLTEKKDEKKGPPHPPAVETTTDGRRRMPPKIEAPKPYPLTLAELRSHDPAVKESFVARLVTETLEYCRQHPDFPPADLEQITDKVMAAMCQESFKTGPKNHGIGLLLSRVPPIAVSWSLENEPIRKDQRRA
jgi:hypothetical protein